MATRSRIGVLNEDNMTVESVYCYWDGYLSNNGRLLFEHWTSPELVRELVGGGDMSSLGTSPGDTKYYSRDMGEELVPPRTHTLGAWPDGGEEYHYVFNPRLRTWSVRCGDDPWMDLGEALRNPRG